MDRRTESRLKKDLVAWFCTVGADRRPHATLVWFWWDGESFSVYSVPGQKTRDVEGNPHVELLLNSDEAGAEMIRASGTARIVGRDSPARIDADYLAKYRSHIKGIGSTPEDFARQYHVAIRINHVRFH